MDDQGYIKLTDFGYSQHRLRCKPFICGTVGWAAPEIVLGKYHDRMVDIFSVGVLTLTLCINDPS